VRQQALAKPVQLASLIEGAVPDGGQRSRQQRAAQEHTGPSRESSIGPVGLQPAGVRLDAARFEDSQQMSKAAAKAEQDAKHKKAKVVRRAPGQPKALAPYSYALNAGDPPGGSSPDYHPEHKQTHGIPGPSYGPPSASEGLRQPRISGVTEAAAVHPSAGKLNP